MLPPDDFFGLRRVDAVARHVILIVVVPLKVSDRHVSPV
jgi:hypothetical protein